jgi:GTP-binding protein
VIADLPGLIAGAAQGAGLGIQFLRHIERCRVLLHLVDLSNPEGSAAADLATVERELAAFNPELMQRPRLIVGSKLDAALPERREELGQAAAERGLDHLEISAATGEGVPRLVAELARRLEGRA